MTNPAFLLGILAPLVAGIAPDSGGPPPPPAPAPGPWVRPPFTLFPAPPDPGEILRCVVAACAHDAPDRASPIRCVQDPGDEVVVRETTVRGDVPWIRVEDGWVEAARVDRPAPPPARDLPVGAEGMATGTILPPAWAPPDLVPLPDSVKAAGFEWRDMELREGARRAFLELLRAAADDSVAIAIVSAYRSGDYQRPLYERSVDRDPSQRTTASPGRSEHQLGTTVDVVTPGVTPFREALAESPAGRWIERRAAEFGVVVTFSERRATGRGVAREPWHLRWVGDRTGDEHAW